VPGELYASNLKFEEIAGRLHAALAQRGFVDAQDASGRIDPARVDLVIRVHAGARDWRQPTVRVESLRWRDGLIPLHRGRGVIMQHHQSWDFRAGGDDRIRGVLAKLSGQKGIAGPYDSDVGSLTNSLQSAGEFEATRPFHLLVVEAFRYADLQEHGGNAKRVWSTFLSIPTERWLNFSDALGAMLRVGTPYFGETTSGLQVFDTSKTDVKLGELQVMESDTKELPPRN
jgi:hypothetical protein